MRDGLRPRRGSLGVRAVLCMRPHQHGCGETAARPRDRGAAPRAPCDVPIGSRKAARGFPMVADRHGASGLGATRFPRLAWPTTP